MTCVAGSGGVSGGGGGAAGIGGCVERVADAGAAETAGVYGVGLETVAVAAAGRGDCRHQEGGGEEAGGIHGLLLDGGGFQFTEALILIGELLFE